MADILTPELENEINNIDQDYLIDVNNSYKKNKILYEKYKRKNDILKKNIIEYDTVLTKLNDISPNNYIIYLIWVIIAHIIAYAVFLNVINEQYDIGTFNKLLIGIVIIFVSYYTFKNAINYTKKYF